MRHESSHESPPCNRLYYTTTSNSYSGRRLQVLPVILGHDNIETASLWPPVFASLQTKLFEMDYELVFKMNLKEVKLQDSKSFQSLNLHVVFISLKCAPIAIIYPRLKLATTNLVFSISMTKRTIFLG